ncbi:MAG: ClbS/DfsB family four-helix bundle protein [Bacteroidota bacterium]
MPRPKTKDELLTQSQANLDKLNELIDGLSESVQHMEFPKGTLNRNIRDVIAHLHHWHKLFLGWYKVGTTGEKPNIPAEGYTWKTLPEFNKKINEKYSEISLEEVRDLFKGSYREVRSLIEQHSEDELFEKKLYKWTGTTSLAAYLISATFSHYDWAFKLIKKSLKQIQPS